MEMRGNHFAKQLGTYANKGVMVEVDDESPDHLREASQLLMEIVEAKNAKER